MTIKKGLFIALIFAILTAGATAHAATNDNRYFVKSTSAFWKKSLVVRNTFDGGFTADLSDWQLKMTKLFGVEVQPVRKLNILAETIPVKSSTPSNQIAWGVEYMYGNTLDDGQLPSGGKDITIAVLDTGANIAHPDLKKRISDCADFISIPSFIDGKCEDKNGHGTSVAGIVAADGGEGEGIYGMAPEASLAIYKVCNLDGTCFSDDVATSIRYAVDRGANIILISIGSDSESLLINDSINYALSKGVLVIAAAGNDGPYIEGIDFPANKLEVVSVGALDSDAKIPDWTSPGANSKTKVFVKEAGDVEFAAPGVSIESTSKDGDYVALSGTSMSAAHIAGLAAKIWQSEEDDPSFATRDLLHQFSQDVGLVGEDDASGWGVPIL